MSTPLTDEQYSELVRALEEMRCGIDIDHQLFVEQISPFAYVYLTQWLHVIGPLPSTAHVIYACDNMVRELCEERCAEPEYQNDVQAAFGGIVQTPQG